jgi:transposase
VDEKTTIQALDRKDPVLPLSPGRAERHGFEYFRHGTLSLYAAFDTKTGEVLGKTAVRHTSAEFVAFLADIVVNQPRGQEIHVIADNLSAHKTKTGQVDDFLDRHPKVHLHFTPTYSSWLNQIELWFAKIERDVIARGVFTSLADLRRKLMKYIRHYNQVPKTVKWRAASILHVALLPVQSTSCWNTSAANTPRSPARGPRRLSATLSRALAQPAIPTQAYPVAARCPTFLRWQ